LFFLTGDAFFFFTGVASDFEESGKSSDEQFDILISILTTQGIICRLALSVVVLKDQYLRD
jgi:hypothetical protein